MNNIDAIIYSYKGKYIDEVINSIYDHVDNIFLIDQHPINRSKSFNDKIIYKHIFWDWQISPCIHKKEFIYKSKSKYILILSDNIIMKNGWSKEFTNFIKDNIVISGSGKHKILKKDLFSIKKDIVFSSNYDLNNIINRDFIFCNKKIFDNVEYPDFIKYNGEEELLSLLMYSNNIKIYSSPSVFSESLGTNSLEHLYVPFSKNHKYNEALMFLQKGNNKLLKTQISKEVLENFYNFHNFNFNELLPLPFIDDDVSYNPNQLNFLSVNGKKFTEKTRAIH